MVAASVLFAAMGSAVHASALVEPPVEAPMASFVRALVNLVVLLVPALVRGRARELLGDGRRSLWLRGLFGGVSLMLSYAAIQRIGPGESLFFTATSAVIVAALAPRVLGQRNPASVWVAIAGATAGVALLLEPGPAAGDLAGRAMGLGSAGAAALAYLMVARAGRSNPPGTVVFYFALVACLMHAAWFAVSGGAWPLGAGAWGLVLLAGITGSLAQWYMTRAYQSAPAALVSVVSYLGPVLGLASGALLFGRIPDAKAMAGCALILGSGVLIPFLTAARPKPAPASAADGSL